MEIFANNYFQAKPYDRSFNYDQFCNFWALFWQNNVPRSLKNSGCWHIIFHVFEQSTYFTVNTPPSKTDFSFLEGGYSKFFHCVVFEGGGILTKILRKNAKCGGACGGLLIIVPSAQALLKRESFIRCATSWHSIFLSFIMVYIHKMCKNVFAPKIVLFTGQQIYYGGLGAELPAKKWSIY